MIARGDTAETVYINESSEKAQQKQAKKEKKKRKQAAFGWDVFNKDTMHKAYERRLENLPKRTKGEVETDVAYELSYGEAPKASAANLEAVVHDLKEMEDRRKNFSRRRTFNKDADIDYINERNHHFNKK